MKEGKNNLKRNKIKKSREKRRERQKKNEREKVFLKIRQPEMKNELKC